VARVEAVRHPIGRQDVDVGGELVVDAAPQLFGRNVRADIEMRDLRERVYAGVGAAGPVQLEVAAARHRSHGPIDLALNRSRVLLNLPAAVPRAGVFDRQLEARHEAF